MRDLKYSEILKLNKELGGCLTTDTYNIVVLSNIIVNQLKEICEYSLRIANINAGVKIGDYDNIVQDSLKYKDSNLVIIFWELCNIIDGLQYKIHLFDDQQIDAIVEKTKSEIDLVFKNLQNTSLVLFNKFSSIHFSGSSINETKLEKLSAQLNQYLADNVQANVKLINLGKVIANVGVNPSLDLRYYYSSKALYTIDFFKAYAEHIKPYIISANGKSKKAIIFDCDDTLWKGVLGEEGFDGIEMASSTRDGAIFSEIQSIVLALNKQGILIGLCSKNNPADVDEVIKSHPDMQLRDEHITIKKVNWSDKVTNLREIAGGLNIGLDSLVFVDDSSFEVNFIKEQIPEITVLQVPDRLHDYPKMLRENSGLFYNLSYTKEDDQKIEMYKQQVQREIVKKKFSDVEGYLSSMGLKLTIFEDNKSIIPRMSQMSQKTNQFNLTTRRYTEGDIKSFIANNDAKAFAFSVSDKFGDSGVTGLCIINIDGNNKIVDIDTLLMSCRVIGRNIEYAFMDYLIEHIKDREINMVRAKYIQTQKNEQVKDFFDRCSFSLDGSTENEKKYVLNIRNYKSKQIHYIEVIDGR
jgi:FkbH-like protein